MTPYTMNHPLSGLNFMAHVNGVRVEVSPRKKDGKLFYYLKDRPITGEMINSGISTLLLNGLIHCENAPALVCYKPKVKNWYIHGEHIKGFNGLDYHELSEAQKKKLEIYKLKNVK